MTTQNLIALSDLLRLITRSLAWADNTIFVSHLKGLQVFEVNCNLIMQIISNWCTSNHMTINLQKSHFLYYTNGTFEIALLLHLTARPILAHITGRCETNC